MENIKAYSETTSSTNAELLSLAEFPLVPALIIGFIIVVAAVYLTYETYSTYQNNNTSHCLVLSFVTPDKYLPDRRSQYLEGNGRAGEDADSGANEKYVTSHPKNALGAHLAASKTALSSNLRGRPLQRRTSPQDSCTRSRTTPHTRSEQANLEKTQNG